MPARRTVFTVVPSLRLGGAEIQALRNCEALLAAGCAVTLVTLYRAEADFFAPELARLRERGLAYRFLLDEPQPTGRLGARRSAGALARCAWRLHRLVAAEAPDWIYTRLWYASLAAWLATGLGARRPRLLFSEELSFADRTSTTAFKVRLRLFLLGRAHRWLVPCRGLFDEALAAGAPARTGAVLPNVVPVPAELPAPSLEAGPLRLGFLGRLEPQKGLERLVAVASRLAAAGCDFRLTIAGAGSQESALREAIAERGLEARVALVGAVADVPAFFRGLDALLLTSHHEGFANVLVEANAAGVPVVAMDAPHGPAEIVREGRNGYLLPNGDVEGMARRLAALGRHELAGMRAECRAIAAEHYSLEAQALRWRALVEEAA